MTLDEMWMMYHKSKLRDSSIRFGQYYCNEKGITNPDIFYCEDDNEVYQNIKERYQPDLKSNYMITEKKKYNHEISFGNSKLCEECLRAGSRCICIKEIIMSKNILMGVDNHDGWKLEDILQKLADEVTAKSEKISDSTHPQRDMIIEHNSQIIKLLNEARDIQVDTYKQLDVVEPNRGPASPRL